jgi:acetoin utilization protein AcuB
MTRDVIVVPHALSVAHAWKILQENRIRHLPVVDDGRLVGIVSDRDLLLLGHTQPSGELGFVDRAVGDIMTLRPLTCVPSTSVAEVVRIMTKHKIDALPVVSGDRIVGLVTSTDLLLLLDKAEEPLPFEFRVAEFSSGEPLRQRMSNERP